MMDAKELFAALLVEVPITEMSDMSLMVVRGMADRVDVEYPQEAAKLREAARLIEEATKAVGA